MQFRVIVVTDEPTNKQTNKQTNTAINVQTGPITIDCAAARANCKLHKAESDVMQYSRLALVHLFLPQQLHQPAKSVPQCHRSGCYWSKDDGGGGKNWCYKSRTKLQLNRHNLLTPSSPGFFHPYLNH